MALADTLRIHEIPSLAELRCQQWAYRAAAEGFGVRIRSRQQLAVLRALRDAGGTATAADLAHRTGMSHYPRHGDGNLIRVLRVLGRLGLVRKYYRKGGPGRIVWHLVEEGTRWEPPT